MTTPSRSMMLCGVLVAAVGCGCAQDPAKTPYAAQPDPIGPNAYPQVVVDGLAAPYVAAVYQRIVVDEPTAERPLAVFVPVRSLHDYRFGIQYEFKWLDAQGREVGKSGSMYQAMDPRMEQQLKGNAMTLAATQWRLEIRLSR